jgi:hypothetical protein
MSQHGTPETTPPASETKKEGFYGPLYSKGDGNSLGYNKVGGPTGGKDTPDPLGYIKKGS